jgi:hypothetical protein
VAKHCPCKSGNQGKQVNTEHKLQERGFRQAYYDCLSNPGAYRVIKFQNCRFTSQQATKYPGAATPSRITGGTAGTATQTHTGDVT